MGFHSVVPLPFHIQVYLLLMVLLVMGVPHGALDFFLDQKISNSRNFRHAGLFLARYLLNMVGYALVWYFFPTVAIVLFIALTAYHFGEIDWMGKVDHRFHRFFYFLLGLSWILFLLSKHIDEAVDIFVLLGQSHIEAERFRVWAGYVLPVSFIVIWVLHGVLLIFNHYFFEDRRTFLFSMVQIVVLSLINVYLPLWLCFAFYFGIWHSLLSFDVLRMQFGIANSWKGWASLLWKAVPYSLLAWAGIVLFIRLSLHQLTVAHLLHLLFIGIAVLALPHLQVFSKIKVARPV